MRTIWDEQERPFLSLLAKGGDRNLEEVLRWAVGVGLTKDELERMMNDLALEKYIDFTAFGSFGGGWLRVEGLELLPRGRRYLGLWPSDDDGATRLAESILREFESRSANEPDEGVWHRLAHAGRDVGVNGLGSLLAAVATKYGLH